MRLPPLLPATLLGRRKRFLADVRLDGGQRCGQQDVAWCANPGRMTSCMGPDWRVWLSAAPQGTGRKLAWTWELSETPAGTLILVHTGRANGVVAEGLAAQRIPELSGYPQLRREVVAGKSRFDLALDGHPTDRRPCLLEVKSVSLRLPSGVAAFPDSVTTRGRKHLIELARLARVGTRAVLVLAVCRGDVDEVRPADHIDPAWAEALRHAIAAGVEVYPQRLELSRDAVVLGERLPLCL